jgi:hypothetical protein
MSWLSNLVNNAAGWGGEDPNAILQRQQAAAAAAAEAERQRQAQALADASAAAGQSSGVSQGTNVGLPKGPTPLAEGFEMGLLPSTFADPFIESTATAGRSKADEFINNMLKRGTTTASGADAARASLSAQDPTVRSQIANISNSLLDQERAKLRGYGPGGDINPAQAEATAFQGGFGDLLAGSLPAGDLYNTSGLGGAAGAATNSRNVTLDPYAVEGGLKTGLADAAAKGTANKKRTTAVF